MKRALLLVAVALAAASSVSAQTKINLDTARRPVPFDRKPVDRAEAKDPNQVQVPEHAPGKAQPTAPRDARSM